MGSDPRQDQVKAALRVAENERLREALEDLEAAVDTEGGSYRSIDDRVLERGYRAALWVLRAAIDDGAPSR